MADNTTGADQNSAATPVYLRVGDAAEHQIGNLPETAGDVDALLQTARAALKEARRAAPAAPRNRQARPGGTRQASSGEEER